MGRLLALVALVAQVATAATAAEDPTPRDIGLTERVATGMVGVPLLLHERRPGGCTGVGAESIDVREDGRSVGPVFLAPAAMPVSHALLVDTGPAALDHLPALREAAAAYVAGLPAGEPALLATFDHRLLLRVPWTADRRRLEDELSWIEAGAESRLWRSTLSALSLMQDRPARKVLIVLTRGCDSAGESRALAEDVLRTATSTDGLSVFFVGISVPARCDSEAVDPLAWPRQIAGRTGGQAFDVAAAEGLGSVLAAIRERVGREVFATYFPAPFGQGPRDAPTKQRSRLRVRRVELRDAPACRASIAGALERCEGTSEDPFCAGAGRRPPVVPPRLALAADGLTIAGRVADVVRDAGAVAPSFGVLLGGAAATGGAREEVRERRVEAWLRPGGELRRAGARPEDAFVEGLRRMVRGAVSSPTAPAAHWTDAPFVVNGETLLSIRGELGRALAERPEEREWATERLRRDRLAVLDAVLSAARPGPARDLLTGARDAVAGEALALTGEDAARYLGAWLGDIPAARVFRAVEVWLAGQLLASRGAPRIPGDARAEGELAWSMLGRLVPPPGEVRLVAWLVPAYDEIDDVVGYHRVLLAPSYSVEIRDTLVRGAAGSFLATEGEAADDRARAVFEHLQTFNYSRGAPLGVWLLRWMLEQEELAAVLSEGCQVTDVRYAHGGERDLLPELRRAGLATPAGATSLPARQVSIWLSRQGDGGRAQRVGAYFARRAGTVETYEPEPLCLILAPAPGAGPEETRLLDALSRASRSVPCVLGVRRD